MSYTLDSWWSPNFNSANYKKTGFTIHHAATTDFSGIGKTFQNTARQASAQYGVEPGHVQQYVADKDVAWHAGNAWANSYTIGIECVNSGGEAQGWPVAEGTIDTLVEFMADKCREHGISELKVGSNLFGHKDFSSTFCPGVLYARLSEIAERVNDILNGETEEDMTPDEMLNAQIAVQTSDGKGQENISFGTAASWCYRYSQNAVQILQSMQVQIAAMSEAMSSMASSVGADPEQIAKAVSDSVAKKLESIDLSVTVD